jgi:hypothetical protein
MRKPGHFVVTAALIGVAFASPGGVLASARGCPDGWSIVPNPAPAGSELFDVSGTSPSDVWAVGFWYEQRYIPLVEHWDGNE